MQDSPYFAEERQRMVREQIAQRGIQGKRLLEAMQSVPRHYFVPPEYQDRAYQDGPLPIGAGQTISQPYIVALMTDLLQLEGDEKVLEIGTGSGYQAAVLGALARQVHSIERHAALAEQARRILSELGITNVQVHTGDGTQGLPKEAPYDGIIVTAAAPRVPQPLLDQLADGGRLVLPIGGWDGQTLELWRRQGKRLDYETVLAVAFVPLIGEHGWRNPSWGDSK